MKSASQKEIIKGAINSFAKKEFIAFLVSKFPFLGLPIINPVFGWVMGILLDKILTEAIIGTNILLIEHQIDKKVSAMNKAILNAKVAIKSGDKKEIAKADAEIIKVSRDLIKRSYFRL